MTNIFFLPSLPASILCNYLFIFLMCIFPTASLFFTSYFLQQSIFLQLVPCYFITPSISHYSLFCCEVFFSSDPYQSFLKILLTTVSLLKYFLLLPVFPSVGDSILSYLVLLQLMTLFLSHLVLLQLVTLFLSHLVLFLLVTLILSHLFLQFSTLHLRHML